MIEKVFICTLLLLVLVIQQQDFGSAQTLEEEATLLENYRGFQSFLDQEKLSSYLSSFGQSTQQADHEIFKRSTNKRKRKLNRKSTTTTTPTSVEDDEDAEIITGKPKKQIYDDDELESIDKFQQRNKKLEKVEKINYNDERVNPSPRQVFKFEIDDAVYSEEYEKFRKAKNSNNSNRKLRSPRSHHSRRVKRSSPADNDDDKNVTTATGVKTEPLNNVKESFVQPREFLRFLISDAVTKSSVTGEHKESGEKKKRETDQTTSETLKNIALTNSNSLQNQNQQQQQREQRHATKHVAFEEMSPKLKGMIESALVDAITRKNANENDYLKFFYGDKIIKVPMSLSKHIKLNFHKETPSKVEYPTKTSSHSSSHSKPTSYYKYEQPVYHTTGLPPTTHHYSGKAESFANFKTPIIVGKPIENVKIPEVEAPVTLFEPHHQKSLYFFTSEHDSSSSVNPSSPGPVLFTTPSSVETPYKSHVEYPTHTEVKFLKDSIPINEHIDESYSGYHPPASPSTVTSRHQVQQLHHAPPHAAALTQQSYADYAGNYDGYNDKNYEFGYHISDYKTGNSFGHTQQKHEKETKGEYSILLPDGRIQIVKYIANDSGFHADVSYENVHYKKK